MGRLSSPLPCSGAWTRFWPLRNRRSSDSGGSERGPGGYEDHLFKEAAGYSFYNVSKFDFSKLLGEPDHLKVNLLDYLNGFSPNALDIFEKYDFVSHLDRLDGANLLYLIVERFASVDLSPRKVSNTDMGRVFEELIRKFAELSNGTAGEHFTPREVIRLLVDLLFHLDDLLLAKEGTVRTLYDPCAGTGGMLSVADEYLFQLNPKAQLALYGQEVNPESYAICKADMLIKGQDVGNIIYGNTLSKDGHENRCFDYMLTNPPFGVDWKKVEKIVRDEHNDQGAAGRFGPGLPRVSDGSLLFLLHLVSKMRPRAEGGSRIGIVLNGSPLFTGGAGSGESEIRRYVLENDLVEAIVALPTDMFYNTGIATYIWVLTNAKPEARKGKVQLIDATEIYQPLRKNMGAKNCELSDEQIKQICEMFLAFEETDLPAETPAQAGQSKIFPNAAFGYWKIRVERPLRLHSQLTRKAIQGLRYASGDEDIRQALHEELGDAIFENFSSVRKQVEQTLRDWGGNGDEDAGGEEDSDTPKRTAIPEN